MIEASGLGLRSPDGADLLHDVSLTLQPGTVTAIIGPNGAGKTTLLRVLAGLLAPSAGSVRFDGVALDAMPRAELARRRAVLGQQQTLDVALPVADVVALGRLPHGRSAQDIIAIAAARDVFGLQTLWRRPYPSLSGGERQRVHLARVTAQLWRDGPGPARALFLDEPTAALDLAQQRLVLDAARAAAADGMVVVQIVHDLNQAARAQHVILLQAGRVAAMGPPDTVLQLKTIRDAFGVLVERVARADGTVGYLL